MPIDVVAFRGVDLAIAIMIAFGDNRPCDGAASLRIAHRIQPAPRPCSKPRNDAPRRARRTFGHAILAGNARSPG